MKNFLGTLFNAVLWFVAVVLLFLVISGLYQHFANADRYCGIAGVGYAVVVSGSMEPNILIDDLIIYHRHDRNEYEVGDVVVYRKASEEDSSILVTHRVVELREEELITKGDANNVADDPISYEDVVGRIVWRIPFVGRVVSFVKTPLGSIITVGAVALVLLLNIFLGRERTKKHSVRTAMGDQIIRY